MADEHGKLYEMFRKLPQDVKEAYESIEYSKMLEDIEKKFHLHVDQTDKLNDEIFRLMVGLIHPEEFTVKVQKGIAVPSETAKQIAGEVNQKIFHPIRASLMKIHKMIDEKEEREEESVENVERENFPLKAGGSEVNPAKPTQAPTKKDPVNIAEEKLKKTFTIPKKEGVYAGKDPYHEEVE